MHGFDLILHVLPRLARGLWLTLFISAVASVAASVLAVPIVLARRSKSRILCALAFTYVQLFRSLSSYVLILFIYFGLSMVLINLSSVPAAVLCLALLQSAYIAEIYRAMLDAVPIGQTEAAQSLGLSRRQVFWDITMPQALRMAAPLLVVQFCQTIKDSSVIAVIGGSDLMRYGVLAVDATSRPFEIYTAVAFLYVLITMLLTLAAEWLFPARL